MTWGESWDENRSHIHYCVCVCVCHIIWCNILSCLFFICLCVCTQINMSIIIIAIVIIRSLFCTLLLLYTCVEWPSKLMKISMLDHKQSLAPTHSLAHYQHTNNTQANAPSWIDRWTSIVGCWRATVFMYYVTCLYGWLVKWLFTTSDYWYIVHSFCIAQLPPRLLFQRSNNHECVDRLIINTDTLFSHDLVLDYLFWLVVTNWTSEWANERASSFKWIDANNDCINS